MTKAYPVSDLAKQRRVVVDAARREPTFIRDTDGEMLVLQRADAVAAKDEILRLHTLRAVVEIECRHSEPNRVAMGELAFLADWPVEERRAFLDDLAAVLASPEFAHDPGAAHFLIGHAAPYDGPTPVLVDDRVIASLGDRLRQRAAG